MPDHNAIQAFQNYALTKDAETCLARLRNIPPTSPEGIRALGVSTPILNWLGEVAGQFGCLIFIRATNPGVLEGVEQAHNTTGKPLTMKGKSSEIDAILSSIAFFAPMAKNVTRKWNESRKEDIEHDQDNLLKIVNDNGRKHASLVDAAGFQYPTFVYTPKLVPVEVMAARLDLSDDQIENVATIDIEVYKTKSGDVSVVTPKRRTGEVVKQLGAHPAGLKPFLGLRWSKVAADAVQRDFQTRIRSIDNHWRTFKGTVQLDFRSGSQLFQLSVRADDFLDKYSATYWDNEDHKKYYDGFAPLQEDRRYRLLPVLAQGKRENPDGEFQVSYFEVVADYDLFSICPSVDQIRKALTTLGTDAEQPAWGSVDAALKEYLPRLNQPGDKVTGQRGIISVYEQRVRKAINEALTSNTGTDSSDRPRFAMHGCEVNNYYHISALETIVMVTPPPQGNPKVSPGFYLDLAGGKATGAGLFIKRSINLYRPFCFLYNLRWFERDGSIMSAVKAKVKGEDVPAKRLGSLLDHLTNKALSSRDEATRLEMVQEHAARIAFFSSYYYFAAGGVADCGEFQHGGTESLTAFFQALEQIQGSAMRFLERLREEIGKQEKTSKYSPVDTSDKSIVGVSGRLALIVTALDGKLANVADRDRLRNDCAAFWAQHATQEAKPPRRPSPLQEMLQDHDDLMPGSSRNQPVRTNNNQVPLNDVLTDQDTLAIQPARGGRGMQRGAPRRYDGPNRVENS